MPPPPPVTKAMWLISQVPEHSLGRCDRFRQYQRTLRVSPPCSREHECPAWSCTSARESAGTLSNAGAIGGLDMRPPDFQSPPEALDASRRHRRELPKPRFRSVGRWV